jgi:BlaI family transcriptional regulator, penicillinase repressor
MTKAKPGGRFTAAEIELLRLLWDHPSLTLAEAHQAMQRSGATVGYTTVQTRLERLVEKGVVSKSNKRPAGYTALVNPQDVSGPLLDLLRERVSGIVPLVAHLLQDSSLTAGELKEMKRLVTEAEKRQQATSRKDLPS